MSSVATASVEQGIIPEAHQDDVSPPTVVTHDNAAPPRQDNDRKQTEVVLASMRGTDLEKLLKYSMLRCNALWALMDK